MQMELCTGEIIGFNIFNLLVRSNLTANLINI